MNKEGQEGGEQRRTYPVANITTSASTVLPSSNSNPVLVNLLIWLSFLSLILPSISICDAPVSVPDAAR